MKRNAFTMVELVFVIVILGILAAVAVPRLAATRDDANIAKYKSDISAIRSSIAMTRSQSLMQGIANFPDTEGVNVAVLFDGVLDYPVRIAGAGETGWTGGDVVQGVDAGGNNIDVGRSYTLRINNVNVVFIYSNVNGVFDCLDQNVNNEAINLCNTLRN